MRYFIDTEFIERGPHFPIDLISIGIVAEDGREYYAQSVEFLPTKASQWVWENVFVHLKTCPHVPTYGPIKEVHVHLKGQCIDQHRGFIHNCPWRTHQQIRHEILSFMDIEQYGTPELWGWCSGYDWVAFCQLFGTMMDLPAGYPHYMRDIQQVLDERGIVDAMLPQPEGQAHHALVDARHIQKIWEILYA